MTFNIWLPILVNVVIVAIVLAGIFIGKKNGFKYEIIKLLIVCGAGVGLYFLNPVVANAICTIPSVSEAIAAGVITIAVIRSLTLLLLFMITYLLITAIFRITVFGKQLEKKAPYLVNTAKKQKPVGVTKKETRKLRREQRKSLRKQKREARRKFKLSEKGKNKASKVFGAITGAIVAVVLAFVVLLPLKPVTTQLAQDDPSLEAIETGYEYTPYGQLDKATDIVDKIIQ